MSYAPSAAEPVVDVSVVIPCRDVGPLLGDAVRSVLDQQVGDAVVDVVIVDDGSSDAATLAEFAGWQEHPRVRVVRNDGLAGSGGARNAGIRAAAGRWIAFLDADDLWLPGSLAARLAVARQDPAARYVAADFALLQDDRVIDGDGFLRSRPRPAALLAPAFASGRTQRLATPVSEFLQAILVWTGAVMVRRDLLFEAGLFDETLRRAQDVHLWIRLARLADLHFVPAVTALYRQRTGSATNSGDAPGAWGAVAYGKLLADPAFKPWRPLIRRRLAQYCLDDCYHYRARGARWRSVVAAGTAVRWAPAGLPGWRALVGAAVGHA